MRERPDKSIIPLITRNNYEELGEKPTPMVIIYGIGKIRSQDPTLFLLKSMDKVQRLNENGLICNSISIRYSPAPWKHGLYRRFMSTEL